ncbi:murein biosynthesis integral membrane protein MurJ [Candidatus Babeliales bacterium]|nr:murein biosynthesis integral membrane protein MurJ [Candidatus Babeliales bacterium]
MSRSILKQGSKIGFFALISRVIAFVREWLLIQFLSVGETSDIFFTAFRIPNTLRKIFAEGALSSILVPAFISAQHKDPEHGLNKLTTAAFVVLEAIIASLCIAIGFFGNDIINFIAPGFSYDQKIQTVYFLRILISFILFISSGAIFAAALQSQRKFFIPSIAPSILNVVYVASLCICLYFHLSVTAFCYFMILTSVVFWGLHIVTYLQQGYSFERPSAQTKQELKLVVLQLIPCIVSFGISEINHFINTGFASYLTSGSMTLLRSSFQFVNIPVGIITASLVTVLLPHFSKLHLEKPQDLMEHLFEAIKFIIWTTLPICFMLFLFSEHIFETLFMGNEQAMSKIILAQLIFKAYLVGLLSFSLNKILLSIFYALRMTVIPMIASIIAIFINYTLNQHLIIKYGAAGIAFASSLSAIIQTIFLCTLLLHHLKLAWPMKTWFMFIRQYCIQITLCSSLLWASYTTLYWIIASKSWTIVTPLCTVTTKTFLQGFGVWFWVGPLCLTYLGLLYITRSWFDIQLTYFDHKK